MMPRPCSSRSAWVFGRGLGNYGPTAWRVIMRRGDEFNGQPPGLILDFVFLSLDP